MKININNKTNLTIKIIAEIFEQYVENDLQITIYDGMKDYKLFEYKNIQYKMTIEHKITYVSLTIEELDIEAKDVSKKGLKFPRLPKKKGDK